ncbi:MAG: orotidine 5'-phosphate decarboxylase [Alectoria sarmentosa]|nr:MAG: orotidine 5'-phosphate decarboxylase [Alectoria sarmentosa]
MGPSASQPRASLQHVSERVGQAHVEIPQPSHSPDNPPHGYVLVPKGDVYVTRHCRNLTKVSGEKLWIVYDRKSNERLGIHCFRPIVEAVKEDAAATEEKRRRAVAAKDSRDHKQAHQLLLGFFPNIPERACKEILGHGFQKGSGRVGRSQTLEAKLKVQLAVNAHIRHRLTHYDSILAANKGQDAKLAAREMVHGQVQAIADSWRTTSSQAGSSKYRTSEPRGSAATLEANRQRRSQRSKAQITTTNGAQVLEEALGGLRLDGSQGEAEARADLRKLERDPNYQMTDRRIVAIRNILRPNGNSTTQSEEQAENARRLAKKVAQKKDRERSLPWRGLVRQIELDPSIRMSKTKKQEAHRLQSEQAEKIGEGKDPRNVHERQFPNQFKQIKRKECGRLRITANGVELEPRELDRYVPESEPRNDQPRRSPLLRGHHCTRGRNPTKGGGLSDTPGDGVQLESMGQDRYVPNYGPRPSIETSPQSGYPQRRSHGADGDSRNNDNSEGLDPTGESTSEGRVIGEDSEWMDIDNISLRTAGVHLVLDRRKHLPTLLLKHEARSTMVSEKHSILSLPFSARAEQPNTPPLATYLLSLISLKRSNLCVSADVHTTYDLLSVAEEVGDYICVLKTHADIIDDWSEKTIRGLQEISRRKHFLLFEDRKLGDIGNTIQSQYTRGPLAICTWAHLTNAHLLPGASIIPLLHSAASSCLTSLNQSVDTMITAGTHPLSLDNSNAVDSPDQPSSISTSTSVTSTSPAQSLPASSDTNPDPSTSASPPQTLFSHTRRKWRAGSLTTATTTISQTFEPTSPRQPARLMHSLSMGEDSEEPQDQKKALEELGPPPHARGLLLLAEMSSAGNLLTQDYTSACIKAARESQDFVLGFVAQRSLNQEANDAFLTFTPGVSLPKEGDELVRGDGKGQQYRGLEQVVGRDGVDVVIVGRGILGAMDKGREAERYRKAAWEAYEGRIGRR